MDYSRLEHHTTGVIQEEQIKLGYRRETIRLYYPLASLNRFLSAGLDAVQMKEALQKFAVFARERLGEIGISNTGERFCLTIPPEGVAYARQQMDGSGFLIDFIQAIQKHGCTIEEVLQTFYRHSGHVHVEKMEQGEFDYLVYFEDGIPDDYRYCITDEGCHIVYHRFTREDYEELLF